MRLKRIDYASSSSEISTSAIQLIVDRLKGGKHRLSTKANYHSIWKHFNEFFIRLDTKPQSWEERLILFVGHLINNKRKSTTIKSYISAIKAVLASDGINLEEDKVLLKSLTRACKLENDTVRTRLPIQKSILDIMLKTLSITYSQQPYLEKLYRAMFTSAYFGMMRVGELTSSQHAVLAKDVHTGVNKKKLMFVLHSSKTHGKYSTPQMIKINCVDISKNRDDLKQQYRYNSTTIDNICPFTIINDYIASRTGYKVINEPFFIFKDRSPIKAENMRLVLKHILTKAGLESKYYNTHSLRAGRSVDLWRANVISQ